MKKLILASAMLTLAQMRPAFAKTISVEADDNAQERLQEALILAEPGDVVELAAGRYMLTDGLSLDIDGVTVRGAGAEATILVFRRFRAQAANSGARPWRRTCTDIAFTAIAYVINSPRACPSSPALRSRPGLKLKAEEADAADRRAT